MDDLTIDGIRGEEDFVSMASQFGGSLNDFFEKQFLPQQDVYCPLEVFSALSDYIDSMKASLMQDLIHAHGCAVGIEITRKTDNGLAVILPETSPRGGFRVSYYNIHGPLNHDVSTTAEGAISLALDAGYHDYTPGRLDGLTDLDSWNKGVVWAWLILRHANPFEHIADHPELSGAA